MTDEYKEMDEEYRPISNLYVNTYHKDQNYIQTCGSKKCAVITLILGFVFFPIWCMGLSTCCKSENDTDCKATYYIYIVQRFLLLIAILALFCLLYYFNVINKMFFYTEPYYSG